jgi:hypothetical protein
VCLEGWWSKNTTNYVCLESSVWQDVQFACKCTCVWKAGGHKIRQITCVWKAWCGKSAYFRNLTANLRVSGRLVAKENNRLRVSGRIWKARCGKSARILNVTLSLRVFGMLVAQKYDKICVSGRFGMAKVLEFAISLQIYVCLEGWWPQNTTNYVCLEGSLWQKCLQSQFDCKFTCVWKAGG